MFRRSSGEDISSQEFELYVLPQIAKVNAYIRDVILPDICAFYIATGYQNDAILEQTYTMHIKTVLDMFSNKFQITKKLKEDVSRILNEKYGFLVIQEEPLQLQKK